MSNTVNVTIDGKKIKVAEGTNLIDAAESTGVHIPNLCYLKGMRGIGACRMCLVEVEGMKAPIIGCTSKVKDGMVVNTKTENVEEIRKFIIDLILSMHPLDCMTCTKAGVCTLQQYAYDFGIKESNFTRKKFGYPIDEANPFIKRDPDYCILCGRCVRVCKEQGTDVLEFMGRGVGSKVVTAMDKPLQESECTFCGSCVDACPVNSLLEADRWRKGREWDYKKSNSVCLSCGNGCDIVVSEKAGAVVKISAGAECGSVEKSICAIGRFGFDSISSDARVTSPMKRVKGDLKEITWKEAIDTVSKKLKSAGSNAGIVSTANILNEDAFVLSKLAAEAVKTKNIDTSASLYTDADSMKFSDSANLDDADAIVLAGVAPNQWKRVLPALAAGIKRRVARGAKLIVLNETERHIMSVATLTIKAPEEKVLGHIAKGLIEKGNKADKDLAAAVSDLAVTEDIEKVTEILSSAKSPVVFCSPSLFSAAKNLSLLIDIKVVAVPFEANARGVVAMGLTTKGKSFKEMSKGAVDVLYAVGEVPVDGKPDAGFIIAQTSYLTGIAKDADIVLPAATYLESQGSITNYLGRVKEVNKCIEPAGDSKQHKDIIIELSTAMGSPVSDADIKISQKESKAKFSPFEKKQGYDANPADIMEAVNKGVINHSRLLWLKEAQEAAV
jgi:NADH dehydrogenase/NADH:ubiquinone oxidoreductase subunit G